MSATSADTFVKKSVGLSIGLGASLKTPRGSPSRPLPVVAIGIHLSLSRFSRPLGFTPRPRPS